jgi:DNA-binding transcriptional regulator YbjK
MKERTKQKLEELTNESEKQNTVLIFEEVSKNLSEKKQLSTELMNSMVKRSLVGSNGVHFIDEKAIEASNASINERYGKLKSECKVKLRDLNNLIDEVNNIKI